MNKIKNAQQALLNWDLKGCLYLNHWSLNRYILTFFQRISRLGDGVFWYLMLLIVWAVQGLGYSLQILYLVVASNIGTIFYKILKKQTLRPRPYQVHQVIRLGERPLDHFSFPSGHTLHAVMISVVLGSIVPTLLLLMLPFTILVALSRMILGLHYPTDVLVGAGLGGCLATTILYCAPFFHIVL